MSRDLIRSPPFCLRPLAFWPLFLKFLVFFAESFDSAGRIYQFLLSGKKRMAFGTDFHMYFRLCGSNDNIVATGAFDDRFRIRRMNRCFHCSGELPVLVVMIVFNSYEPITHSWNLKSLYYSLFRSFFQAKIQGCPWDSRTTAVFAESRPGSMSRHPKEVLPFGCRIS